MIIPSYVAKFMYWVYLAVPPDISIQCEVSDAPFLTLHMTWPERQSRRIDWQQIRHEKFADILAKATVREMVEAARKPR